ncbi:MAG: alpha-1,4-glucan--maltose-1-phosphate maltosyltransferase [Chitinophagales bacterium]
MKKTEGQKRTIIENILPQIDGGLYPIKRVVGETVTVSADIFSDGHDVVNAVVVYRHESQKKWRESPMQAKGNDVWIGSFPIEKRGKYEYTVQAWIDHPLTWQAGFRKKAMAGQNMKVELQIGADLLQQYSQDYPNTTFKKFKAYIDLFRDEAKYKEAAWAAMSSELESLFNEFPLKKFPHTSEQILAVKVERKKAAFSAWYEFFPRSTSREWGQHGTFQDCKRVIDEVAKMGFDTVYFPPIHAIGEVNRKGKNNSVISQPEDPGSPWAIGSKYGGHTSIHSELGTLEDFKDLVQYTKDRGIEIALDIAFQCAPDHPWVKEHPDWFKWRPDGTVQYAENPPKKYEDILPIYFETEDWEALWTALKDVMVYWVKQGINIFRIDNPHTKSFRFWEWAIGEINAQFPDIIFLAEAFTRPRIMEHLAKIGFQQSYTYFTWREDKASLSEYMQELTKTNMRNYYRPNFWPNTPDILPDHLQYAPPALFKSRYVLAATLSSNYGMYGPSYEFCLNIPDEKRKEYIDSEKYELKAWDWHYWNDTKELIWRVNMARKKHPALQSTYNITLCQTDNPHLMAYMKCTDDLSDILYIVVNMNTDWQQGYVQVPLHQIGVKDNQVLEVHDLLTNQRYRWEQSWNYVALDPSHYPAHIFSVKKIDR